MQHRLYRLPRMSAGRPVQGESRGPAGRLGVRRPRRLRGPLLLGTAVVLAMALGSATMGASSSVAADPDARDRQSAEVVFEDTFDGPEGAPVDDRKWQHETGDNENNHERQWYTEGNNNAALDGDGNLVITARQESPGNQQCWYGTCEYTSARLNTAGLFTQQYGHFEARMKVPRGQGMWPAFWALGEDFDEVDWPASGEIDIMENVGFEPGTVHGSLHGPGYSGENGVTGSHSLPAGEEFADDFHTFAIDWSPGSISWSVDGTTYQTKTPDDLGGQDWVFDKPFFLILNLAVGGDWPGDPDESTEFPQQLVVDYVRVTAPE